MPSPDQTTKAPEWPEELRIARMEPDDRDQDLFVTEDPPGEFEDEATFVPKQKLTDAEDFASVLSDRLAEQRDRANLAEQKLSEAEGRIEELVDWIDKTYEAGANRQGDQKDVAAYREAAYTYETVKQQIAALSKGES